MPVYKDKERGTWYYSFRKKINGIFEQGKARGFNSKAEAQAMEQEHIARLKNGNNEQKKDATLDILFNDFINDRQTKIRITSLKTEKDKYRVNIEPYLGNVNLRLLTTDTISKWKQNLVKQKYSQSHTNKVILVLRQCLQYGISRGYNVKPIVIDALGKVNMQEISKEREILTYDEIDLFLSTFDLTDEKEKTYHDYFYALSRSGMRPNEFRALTKSDIQGNYLNVNKDITSKIAGQGDIIQPCKNEFSVRKVLMPQDVIDMLNDRCNDYNDDDFIFGKEKAFRETNLNRMLIKHLDVAGLKHIPLYSFRHSHATHLIRNGVMIKVVSKRLGHKDIQTTINTYQHLLQEDEESVLKLL